MVLVRGPAGALIRKVCLPLAGVCFSVALALALSSGRTIHLGLFVLTVHRPQNPALLGALLVALYVTANGVRTTGEEVHHSFVRAHGWLARLDERALAGLIALGTLAIGLAYATTVAGGADSYGYLSQADLWIAGNLHVQQPWVRFVPWPNAAWTFSPLGYHPGHGLIGTLVPVYSPGLPILMAIAKRLAGQAAMFWVVPLSGALLVFSTYGIGRRLASPKAGLAAAWLVATSPAVLFMLMAPMTDVPVAGFWALSFWMLLGETAAEALVAGLAAGIAVLIRPNLVIGVPFAGLWYLIALFRVAPADRGRAFRAAALFALGPLAAVGGVARFNEHMYRSPFTSGYGAVSDLFSAANVTANAHHYFGWLVDSQTYVAALGLVALLLPLRRLWPAAKDRLVFVPVGLFVAALWGVYLAYSEFDVWWYLRFLLASWPFIMVGVGAVAVALVGRRGRVLQLAMTIGVILLGLRGIGYAEHAHAFALWHEDRRYVIVGQLARELTPDSSVIFAMQHSGSLRYYAGRVTIRYDMLQSDWIDRSIQYLSLHGIHAYLVVEDWEIPDVRREFEGTAAEARLDDVPLFIFHGSNTVRMYDLSQVRDEAHATARVIEDPMSGHRDVPPAPLSPLMLTE